MISKNVVKPVKQLTKPLIFWGFLFVLVGFFTLAGAEIALRISGFYYPFFKQWDPVYGTVNRPHARAIFTQEGYSHVKLNSLGFNDPERSLGKSAGRRILVLGDSMTEALQVEQSENFCALVEKSLRADFGEPLAEVLNWGIGGWGTAQQLLLLAEEGWKYQPDIVVCAFFVTNDVVNNGCKLEYLSPRPFLVKDSNGQWNWDMSFRESQEFRKYSSLPFRCLLTVSDHVRLVQWTKKMRDYSRDISMINREPRMRLADVDLKSYQFENKSVQRITSRSWVEDEVFVAPTEKKWLQAWDATEELLTRMARNCAQNKARLVLFILPDNRAVDPDINYRKRSLETVGAESWTYPEERLKTIAEKNGVTLVNGAADLSNYSLERGVFLHGFHNTILGSGHLNEEGHRAAAQSLRQGLEGIHNTR